MKLSVCIPVFNGARTIEPLVDDILSQYAEMDMEIVLVNDGSPDDSEAVCIHLATQYKAVKFIGLRRNFGEHNAVMCALAHSSGDYIAVIDDDAQNPPSEIRKLLEIAQTGKDVVYARYIYKRHSWLRNLGSRFNNAIATWLLKKPRDLYLSSFKVMSRELVRELLNYSGPFPYLDGLILRATDSIAIIPVEHHSRPTGKSNYTLSKLVHLWLSVFVNFSQKPLRIALATGLFLSAISSMMAIYFVAEKIFHPVSPPRGWVSLIVVIFFMGSVQLIFLGLLGEYIGKIYLDINRTPQWVVKMKIE